MEFFRGERGLYPLFSPRSSDCDVAVCVCVCVPQGVWKPRKIANPDFFEDQHPFRMSAISAVGLELWSMTADIFFDNFLVTDDRNVAERWANDGWGLKKAAEGAAEVEGL